MNKGRLIAGLSAAVVAIAAPFVARFEATKLEPYRDLAGNWTVCTGETHVEMRPYSPAECAEMFQASLVAHGEDAQACLPEGLPPHVYAAAWSIAYNMGAPSMCASKFARRLRDGEGLAACSSISELTTISKGKIDCRNRENKCYGIVVRRNAERSLCEGQK